jgi:hypothetical protein
VDFEPLDDFEQELRTALERRPAPPGLKRRLMEQRNLRRTQRVHRHTMMWQRLAAAIVLAAVVGGGFVWRNHEERIRGEEAREQVLTALRITGHALNQVNTQLATVNRRAAQE